jgi:hypothetical protein
MQTTSYRVLKWTLLMGVAASMATACVVTSGDGGGDGDAGESGSSNTEAGKTSTGGTSAGSSTGGKTSSGGGGMTSTAGTTAAGGDAGAASTYVPGLCEADAATPTMEPSCAPKANDDGQTCKICLKAKCCSEWQGCYADTPTTACGYGATEDARGQFDCIQKCFTDGAAMAADPDMLLADCAAGCANQCDNADNGLIMTTTSDLVDCANTSCTDECFPFN